MKSITKVFMEMQYRLNLGCKESGTASPYRSRMFMIIDALWITKAYKVQTKMQT